MASSVDVKFEEICRTCMGCSQENPGDKSFQLTSLFDYVDDRSQSRRIQLYDILNFAVPKLPKIDVMDELPNNICTRCVEKLFAIYEFQNDCISSDLRLRNLIQTDASQLRSDVDTIQSFIKEEIMTEEIYDASNTIQTKGYIDNCEIDSESQVLQENLTEELNEIESKVDIFDHQIVNPTVAEKYKEVWKCKVCEQCFSNKDLLVLHREDVKSECKANIKKKKYSCKICFVGFPQETNFITHMKNIHNSDAKAIQTNRPDSTSANKAPPCSNSFETKGSENLKETTIDFKGTNNVDKNKLSISDGWTCEICKNTYSHKGSLKRHMQMVHKNEQVTDSNSGKTFDQKSSIQKCDECECAFQSWALLNQHKVIHKDPYPLKCRYCKKGFKNNIYRMNHELQHKQQQLHIGQPLPQSDLQLAIDPEETLSNKIQSTVTQNHQPQQKLESEVSLPTDCQNTAMLDRSLQQLNHEEQLFICSRCGKDFRDINSLMLHAQLHDSEKRFECLFCKEKFNTYSATYSHQRKTHKDLM